MRGRVVEKPEGEKRKPPADSQRRERCSESSTPAKAAQDCSPSRELDCKFHSGNAVSATGDRCVVVVVVFLP